MTVALFVLLFSLRGVLAADLIRSHRDTRVEAARWIEQNVPPRTTIASETYGPPLVPTVETFEKALEETASPEFHHPTQMPARIHQYYEWVVNVAKRHPLKATYDLVILNDALLDSTAVEHNRFPQTNYDFDRLRGLGVRYVVINSFQYQRFTSERARAMYPKRAGFYDRLVRDHHLVKEIAPRYWQPGPVIRIYSLEDGA